MADDYRCNVHVVDSIGYIATSKDIIEVLNTYSGPKLSFGTVRSEHHMPGSPRARALVEKIRRMPRNGAQAGPIEMRLATVPDNATQEGDPELQFHTVGGNCSLFPRAPRRSEEGNLIFGWVDGTCSINHSDVTWDMLASLNREYCFLGFWPCWYIPEAFAFDAQTASTAYWDDDETLVATNCSDGSYLTIADVCVSHPDHIGSCATHESSTRDISCD